MIIKSDQICPGSINSADFLTHEYTTEIENMMLVISLNEQ